MIEFLLLATFMFADSKVDLETGIRAESNAMYTDRGAEADLAAYIKPSINLLNAGKRGNLFFNLDSEYSKYASNANLDTVEYNAATGFDWHTSKNTSLSILAGYEYITEPPQQDNLDLIDYNTALAKASFEYRQSNISKHIINTTYKTRTYGDSDLDYMANTSMSGEYLYYYYFLPETSFIVQLYGDASTYPDGRKLINSLPGTTRYLNNSIGYKVAAGLEGRLTEFSLFRFLFGYFVRNYEYDSGFNEPVFEVSFQEQITPQDTLLAGYNYQVVDSTYTNYELNQQMYLGYSRVFSDRFILLFRSNYMYKTYSLPNRREDQQLYGTLQIDFSYKPNWIFKAGFSGDVLLSDALNLQTSAVDPATSYQAYQLFFATKVVF